jgi:hypothetical protein
VTWSLLALKVGTLNTHGVCTISLQAAVHPLSGPRTTTTTTTIPVRRQKLSHCEESEGKEDATGAQLESAISTFDVES